MEKLRELQSRKKDLVYKTHAYSVYLRFLRLKLPPPDWVSDILSSDDINNISGIHKEIEELSIRIKELKSKC